MKHSAKAIFLDRDGTLNPDPGYIDSPDKMALLPNSGEGLKHLKKMGFLLVVTSNQSGVGRGLIELKTLPLINARLNELLKPFQVQIDHFEMCIHHPDKNCLCRKPEPGMILNSSKALGITVSESFMIGDRHSDLMAGRNAGCKASILVRTGDGKKTESTLHNSEAHFIADDLLAAAQWIETQLSS